MFLPDVHALGLDKAQGLLLTETFYWDLNDNTRAWSKRFAALHGGKMPSSDHAGVYAGVLHYLKAVETLQSDDADKVMAQMKATPVKDFYSTGQIRKEDGRFVHDMFLLQVKAPKDSVEPWDYFKVVTRIPGAEAFTALADSKCKR